MARILNDDYAGDVRDAVIATIEELGLETEDVVLGLVDALIEQIEQTMLPDQALDEVIDRLEDNV